MPARAMKRGGGPQDVALDVMKELVRDPKGFDARLAALDERTARAQEAEARATAAQDQLAIATAATTKSAAGRMKAFDEVEARQASQARALVEASGVLDARKAELDARQAAQDQRQAEQDAQQTTLGNDARLLAEQEGRLQVETEQVASERNKLERGNAALRERVRKFEARLTAAREAFAET